MDVETAIRTRRTHKAYGPEPVARETLDELLDLARWAPNHHLTNPWRFRVLGPRALERLKRAAGAGGGGEARPGADPGRLLVRARRRPGPGRGGPARDRDRRLHRPARRSRPRPGRLLADPGGAAHEPRAARPSGSPDDERFVGLIHLGRPVQEQRAARARARRRARSRTWTEPPMLARADALEAVTGERFDVVVIGGGITGAGVALDAASRGYSVALVERDDYAIGHLEPLLEDGPRRASLPAELRPRAGPRGAARAPADGPARAAPRLPDPVPGPDARRGPPRPHARDRAQHVRRDGDDAGRRCRAASAPRARLEAGRATTGRPTATARSPARRWSS